MLTLAFWANQENFSWQMHGNHVYRLISFVINKFLTCVLSDNTVYTIWKSRNLFQGNISMIILRRKQQRSEILTYRNKAISTDRQKTAALSSIIIILELC